MTGLLIGETIVGKLGLGELILSHLLIAFYSSVAKRSGLFHLPTEGNNVCIHKIAQS